MVSCPPGTSRNAPRRMVNDPGMEMFVPDETARFGTPQSPKPVKCTSLGQPSSDRCYWSIVLADGQQICLGFTFDQLRLVAAQSSKAVAGWPVNVEEPAA